MKVFLDSSFIISYVIKSDSNHKKASKLDDIEKIFNNECYVSNIIINEIISILGNKKGVDIAFNTYRVIKDNCIIINEYDIPYFNDKVINTYSSYNAKLSFTDTAILEIMKHYGIPNLVTFDKEFKKCKGIKVLA